MSIPTPEEIKKEIKALEEMQPKVKRFSAFGDDHHEAIDAQLDVLKNDLTDDEIDEQYENHARSNAQDARLWLDGEGDSESPSEEWQGLVQE